MPGVEQIEELLREGRKADKEDREKGEALGRLIAHPDWKVFVKMLDKKCQLFGDQLMVPSGGVDGCIRQEFVKGALSGLIMARDLPSVTIAAARELRQPEESGDAST